MVEGYNISLQINSKTILGRTQDDLSISAVVKESITKDDAGVMQRSVVRHDVTFSVNALLSLNGTGTTQLDRDDVIALALATGSSAIIPVTYICAGGATYGGNAIITGYSESSGADPDADTTLSLDLQITGDFAIVS
ncbi:MAG: hypothetical protein II008_17125 [Oscillospiraceae bacterium]|nr:hypothetical protein [Oscillospiraceae bacterium]